MPSDNKLELVIQVDAQAGNAAIKSVSKNLSDMEKTAIQASKEASRGIDGMTASVAKGVIAGEGLLAIIKEAALGLKEFTLGAIETQAEIGKTAQKIGLTTEQFSALRYVAKITNTDVDGVTRAVGQLAKNMLISTQGTNAQNKAFALLHVNVKNSDGSLRGVQPVLEDLANRFAKMPDGATKTALAMQLLGRNGKEMIPILNRGGAEIHDMTVEAQTFGEIVDEKTAKAAEDFIQQLLKLKAGVEGLSFRLAAELLPKITELAHSFVDWVKTVDMDALVAQLKSFGSELKEIGIFLGSYILIANLVKVGQTLASMVGIIRSVTTAVLGLSASIGALNVVLSVGGLLVLAGAITIVVSQWEHLHQLNLELDQTRKNLESISKIKAGATLDELKAGGATSSDVKSALGGGRTIKPFSLGDALPNREQFPRTAPESAGEPIIAAADKNAKKLLEEMAKWQAEALKQSEEFLLNAEDSTLRGPFKAALDVVKEIEKTVTRIDSQGVTHRIQLSTEAAGNFEQALHVKVQNLQKEEAAQIIKDIQTEAAERLKWDTEGFQRRMQFEQQIDDLVLGLTDRLESYQEDRAAAMRDSQLRALEAVDAKSITQKVAVENQKATIEIQYIQQVHDLKLKLFDEETDRELQAIHKRAIENGIEAQVEAKAEQDFADARANLRTAEAQKTQDAIDAQRQAAAVKQAQDIREFAAKQAEQVKQVFDSIKSEAGKVFDALITRSKNAWQTIGDLFKTTVLTAIKDTFSSITAGLLTPLMLRIRGALAGALGGVGGAGGGANAGFGIPGVSGGGGAASSLGAIALGSFWIGGPVGTPSPFGGGGAAQVSVPVGTPTFAGGGGAGGVPVPFAGGGTASPGLGGPGGTPPFFGGGGGNGGLGGILGSVGGGKGFGGILQNLKGLFGIPTVTPGTGGSPGTPPFISGPDSPFGDLGFPGISDGGSSGSIQLGPGQATTPQGLTLGDTLTSIGKSPAAFTAGIGLTLNGLQRGGLGGTLEAGAGGALIGFQFGGPIGAAIGAAAGLVAGGIRSIFGTDLDHIESLVKSTYGVDIKDKGVLQQIKNISDQKYGGKDSLAVLSPDVRQLVQLYGITTGQQGAKFPTTMMPSTLIEQGGGVYQAQSYLFGTPQASAGGALATVGPVRGYQTGGKPSPWEWSLVGERGPELRSPDGTIYPLGSSAMSRVGLGANPGNSANRGHTVIRLDGPATTSLLRGEAVSAIAENPRAVQAASIAATRASAGRRTLLSLQLSPGALTN